jgi:hypothetical protein
MRNCGIGDRGGRPFLEMPVVNSVTIWSSVPGGVPASLGATSAQPSVGLAGAYGTGPPNNQRCRSG